MLYEKIPAPARKHNLLESHVGYSSLMCAHSCNRLSCKYFAISSNLPEETKECNLFGDVETMENDHGDVTVYMKFGKMKLFISKFF